jgi:hypothetical protein
MPRACDAYSHSNQDRKPARNRNKYDMLDRQPPDFIQQNFKDGRIHTSTFDVNIRGARDSRYSTMVTA